MSKRPAGIPQNILDELMPTVSESTQIRQSLRWDYSQAGAAADEVRSHAIEIKRSERRASEAILDAGQHLIAVKERLQHGQWEDWLQTEFNMSIRTAQRMMDVATKFVAKSDTVSLLGPSVLYLLAGDNTPEAAREEVVERARRGETITQAQAKAIIEEHKPKRLFIDDLRLIVERWIAEAWQQEWPENPSHTNGQFWQEITAWLHATVHTQWSESDLKFAIKQAHAASLPPPLPDGRDSETAAPPSLPPLDMPMPNAPAVKGIAQRVSPYITVWEIQRILAAWAMNIQPFDLRITARYRGDAHWFEARQLLLGLLYRDRDLAQALNNLADIAEQRAKESAEARDGGRGALLDIDDSEWSEAGQQIVQIMRSQAGAPAPDEPTKKTSADSVEEPISDLQSPIIFDPQRLQGFLIAFSVALEQLGEWAAEYGHQVEAGAAARALRVVIERIEADLENR